MNRAEYGEMPPEPDRLQVCAWLRHHGIDPNEVAVPGWIERHPETRRIAYAAYQLDEDGAIRLNDTRDEAIREARFVQLEAVPSPFPPALQDEA